MADMIADIHKVGPLTYPKIFQYDNGSEFKEEVTKMLERHEVAIRRTTTKYKHNHDTETQMIGMKPNDAIKLNQVPLVNRENYPPEDTLPEDGLYHYLLQPSEEHDDQRKRATDRIWSKKTYRLREIVEGLW